LGRGRGCLGGVSSAYNGVKHGTWWRIRSDDVKWWTIGKKKGKSRDIENLKSIKWNWEKIWLDLRTYGWRMGNFKRFARGTWSPLSLSGFHMAFLGRFFFDHASWNLT
jgi:hypothetical protein